MRAARAYARHMMQVEAEEEREAAGRREEGWEAEQAAQEEEAGDLEGFLAEVAAEEEEEEAAEGAEGAGPKAPKEPEPWENPSLTAFEVCASTASPHCFSPLHLPTASPPTPHMLSPHTPQISYHPHLPCTLPAWLSGRGDEVGDPRRAQAREMARRVQASHRGNPRGEG